MTDIKDHTWEDTLLNARIFLKPIGAIKSWRCFIDNDCGSSEKKAIAEFYPLAMEVLNELQESK